MYVLGLMSGTSADGVDAALVNFTSNLNKPRWRLLNSASLKYPHQLQKKIVSVGQGLKLSSSEWVELSEGITEIYYSAVKKCDPDDIARLIGCHGQTVYHRPPKGSVKGASMQLLQAPLLATLTGKRVVFDFRAKDLALGGHGAPFSPLIDDALISSGNGWRGVLNLGGIANLTLIPPRFGPDRQCGLLGWDCGPANSLIDLAVLKISEGELNFDLNGLIALKGDPDRNAIKRWLNEDFFKVPPPKSTGREKFGLEDLNRRLLEMNTENKNDVVATMTHFTASIIWQDLQTLSQQKGIQLLELFVAGGGSENPVLMQALMDKCQGIRVLKTDKIGIPVQTREAIGFALLAWWNINQKASNHLITGAKRPSVLGVVVSP